MSILIHWIEEYEYARDTRRGEMMNCKKVVFFFLSHSVISAIMETISKI